jgi:hypothetical protein
VQPVQVKAFQQEGVLPVKFLTLLQLKFFALYKHEGESAIWAGNSPNVIHRHYKALVKEAEAKKFWGITPATVKSKIANFQGKAAAAA